MTTPAPGRTYFKEQAVDNMRFVQAAKKSAQEQNITLEAEDQQQLDENLKSMKDAAAEAGFNLQGLPESHLRRDHDRLRL